MKKTFPVLTVLSLIVLCLFLSCHKSEYNPKKKISKIYESGSKTVWLTSDDATIYDTYPKSLKERWIWEGNKLIQMDLEGDVFYFFYDKNRLDKIEMGSIVAQIEYEGKYVKKIVGKDQDELLYEMEVLARDKHRITKAKYTYYYESYIKNATNLTALDRKMNFLNSMISSSFLADIMRTEITAIRKMKGEKAIQNETYTIDYTYSGNNVTQISLVHSDRKYTETKDIVLQYDNKKNPYYMNPERYYSEINDFFAFGLMESENNITSIKGINTMTPTIYTYEYDGEWPTKRIYKETWQGEEYGSITEDIRYFEYTK